MKNRYLLLLSLVPLLGMSKCEKEPAPEFTLPPPTQTGANTMGFMVNGRAWQSYGVRCTLAGCDTNRIRSEFSKRGLYFTLNAGQTARDVDEFFRLALDSITRAGTFRAFTNQPGAPYRASRSLNFADELTRDYYSTTRPSSATFVITRADTIQRILSGTFEGTLRNLVDSTKSVTITNGRFDVRYQQR